MKKFLGLVLAVVMIGETVAYAEEKPLISVGDYNEDVIALNRKLNELGLLSLRAESPWGLESVEALKTLQDFFGMEETGVVNGQEDLNQFMDASFEGYNLATGTEKTMVVAPVGNNDWCNPHPLYATSELGMILIKNKKTFMVSFDWSVTGVDTAVDLSVSLKRDGEHTWYDAVGRFSINTGDSEGHFTTIFEPTEEMRQHGTGWLIGGVGKDTNRNIEITISNFMFIIMNE